MRMSRAMRSNRYACRSGQEPLGAPITETDGRVDEPAAPPLDPAARGRSSGSTSSRWPSLAAGAWALVTHGDAPARRRRTCPWWAVALGLRRAPSSASSTSASAAARTRSRSPTCRSSSASCSPPATTFVLGALVGTGIVCGLIRRLRARQARLQPRPARARRRRSPPASCTCRRQRRRAAARDLGRPLRRDARPAARSRSSCSAARSRSPRAASSALDAASRCSPPTRSSR